MANRLTWPGVHASQVYIHTLVGWLLVPRWIFLSESVCSRSSYTSDERLHNISSQMPRKYIHNGSRANIVQYTQINLFVSRWILMIKMPSTWTLLYKQCVQRMIYWPAPHNCIWWDTNTSWVTHLYLPDTHTPDTTLHFRLGQVSVTNHQMAPWWWNVRISPTTQRRGL